MSFIHWLLQESQTTDLQPKRELLELPSSFAGGIADRLDVDENLIAGKLSSHPIRPEVLAGHFLLSGAAEDAGAPATFRTSG
jgi:hypothetical protein